jgi:hypothetical protein
MGKHMGLNALATFMHSSQAKSCIGLAELSAPHACLMGSISSKQDPVHG